MSNVNPAPAYLDEARYNIYHGIHKGIRYGHSRLLMLIGATEAAVTAAEVRDFLMLGQGHLAAEEAEIHVALEAREPGASAHAEDDHAHHEISFKELETLLLAMEHAAPQRRAAEGRALYHRFALFTAADLDRLHAEETRMLAALHRNFTDAEPAKCL